MGKGKGKLSGWSVELPSGIMIFEFKNLRFGRSMYFINQIKHKMPVLTSITKKHNYPIRLTINKSKLINYDTFW